MKDNSDEIFKGCAFHLWIQLTAINVHMWRVWKTGSGSLDLSLQHSAGNQVQRCADTAVQVTERVSTQVSEQQLGASVQQVQDILRQCLQTGVTYFLQVEDVLQEEQHLLLQDKTENLSYLQGDGLESTFDPKWTLPVVPSCKVCYRNLHEQFFYYYFSI